MQSMASIEFHKHEVLDDTLQYKPLYGNKTKKNLDTNVVPAAVQHKPPTKNNNMYKERHVSFRDNKNGYKREQLEPSEASCDANLSISVVQTDGIKKSRIEPPIFVPKNMHSLFSESYVVNFQT